MLGIVVDAFRPPLPLGSCSSLMKMNEGGTDYILDRY